MYRSARIVVSNFNLEMVKHIDAQWYVEMRSSENKYSFTDDTMALALNDVFSAIPSLPPMLDMTLTIHGIVTTIDCRGACTLHFPCKVQDISFSDRAELDRVATEYTKIYKAWR